MTKIPEDVRRAAHMAWQNGNTKGNLFTADGQSEKYVPIIARAIMAERERCAKRIDAITAHLRLRQESRHYFDSIDIRIKRLDQLAAAIRGEP